MADEKTTNSGVAWQCTVCGYIEKNYPDGLPEGYKCPVCGAPASMFKKVEAKD